MSRSLTRWFQGSQALKFSATLFFAALLCAAAVAQTGTLEVAGQSASVVGQVMPAQSRPNVGEAGIPTSGQAIQAAPLDESGRARYMVRFAEAPLALYAGGIQGLEATNPDARGENRLQTDSEDTRAYLDWLAQRQAEHLSAIQSRFGRGLQVERSWRVVINATAIRLTPEEAESLGQQPGIVHVERDYASPLLTDFGPELINADTVWDGSATPFAGTRGEGVIVGIMDTGINMEHPFFAATDSEGYTHSNPFGSGNFVGWCDPLDPNYDSALPCNDKLIGAWDYSDANWPESDGPRDNNGHGSHVASTAAGNLLTAPQLSPTYAYSNALKGVAPRANIISYDVCGDRCFSSDVVAAIEQAVLDGVNVLNESIGIGGDTFNGSKQQAYLGALAAGVIASRSAGNSGPGAGTVGPEPVWTISTAATGHVNRSFNNQLTGLSGGDTTPPADISGQAMSGAYGPATIVYAEGFVNDGGSADDGQCLQSFPAGTWTGEIVVCDRGQIARTQKGENVLAGGAGGMIFADNGGGIAADPHVLPAIHISQADGTALKTWLASGSGHEGSITEATVSIDTAPEDVLAAFSSRGPADAAGVIKPDLGAPGRSILAAWAASPTESETYAAISGTSMASPHATGASALIRAIRPGWTPAEVRSALMGTAEYQAVRKETLDDSDPFDIGGGRIDLARAAQTGLILNETAANFDAADPADGGDPRTLNLASLGDDGCYQACSWQRTFRSAVSTTHTWEASYVGAGDVQIQPSSFTLGGGASVTLDIDADMRLGTPGTWNFGHVILTDTGGQKPDFTLPLAAFLSAADSVGEFSKTDDVSQAQPGEFVTYTLTAAPFAPGSYTVSDPLPPGVTYVNNSATNGLVYDAGTNSVNWSGNLNGADMLIAPSGSPAGYLPLASLGVSPSSAPSNCDDGGSLISGLDFSYLGDQYTDVIWSVNGTLEAGTASLAAASFTNAELPDGTSPNNVIAPLWTDLSLCDTGAWYQATLNSTTTPTSWHVFEWTGVPLSSFITDSDPSLDPVEFSFQIWIEVGTDNIWFTYGPTNWETWTSATVGVEGPDGVLGTSYYFNGTGTQPAQDDALGITATVDQQVMTFQVSVEGDPLGPITNEATLSDGSADLRAWSAFEAFDPDLVFRDRFEQQP